MHVFNSFVVTLWEKSVTVLVHSHFFRCSQGNFQTLSTTTYPYRLMHTNKTRQQWGCQVLKSPWMHVRMISTKGDRHSHTLIFSRINILMNFQNKHNKFTIFPHRGGAKQSQWRTSTNRQCIIFNQQRTSQNQKRTSRIFRANIAIFAKLSSKG